MHRGGQYRLRLGSHSTDPGLDRGAIPENLVLPAVEEPEDHHRAGPVATGSGTRADPWVVTFATAGARAGNLAFILSEYLHELFVFHNGPSGIVLLWLAWLVLRHSAHLFEIAPFLLVLACPLTEATFHFLDRSRLAVCQGAYLINVGRGALVEEAALPAAFDAGWLSGAALDVYEREPLPAESPLWEHPAVTLSPHISGLTTIPGAAAGFLACLAEVEAGRRPALAVDVERGY